MGKVLDSQLHDELQSLSAAYVLASSRVSAELNSGPIGRALGDAPSSHLAAEEAEVSAIIRRINRIKGITEKTAETA